MLMELAVVIILQYIHTSNQYIVHLILIQCYIALKLEKMKLLNYTPE